MKISEHANYLLNEYGRLQFDYAAYYKPYGESLRNEARNNLEEYIAELETENAELKPYRDGYDACENFPEEGVNVIAARGNWFFLAQRRGDKWYDSLGQQAEIRGGIERWWKLPEVQE